MGIKNKTTSKSNLNINSRFFFALGILFLTLSFLVKLKFFLLEGKNYDYLVCCQNFHRPNFLTLLAINSLVMALITNCLVEKSKVARRIYITTSILLISLFILWVILSGVGRGMNMYFLLGLIANLYVLGLLGTKRIIIGITSIFLFWLIISAFKAFYSQGQIINYMTINDFLTHKIILRISQAHIFEAIVNTWQNDNDLLFYGWQDFFTAPALGVNRVYLSGSEFGHAFNLIANQDNLTGVGPTYLGDLYIRGGLWMSYIGAILIGVLYRTYDKFICRGPLIKTLILNGLLFPFLLHGTEDFVFLTISTGTLIFLFVSFSIWFVGLFIKLSDEKL